MNDKYSAESMTRNGWRYVAPVGGPSEPPITFAEMVEEAQRTMRWSRQCVNLLNRTRGASPADERRVVVMKEIVRVLRGQAGN